MRAFLGRTAFYWQPFLITVIGFSLLALWYANLSPGGEYGLPTEDLILWLGFTLLIGLPGMGTLRAIVGARAKQRGRALVAGLVGIIVWSLIVMTLQGDAESVAEGFVLFVIVASVPFLVGFGAAALWWHGR